MKKAVTLKASWLVKPVVVRHFERPQVLSSRGSAMNLQMEFGWCCLRRIFRRGTCSKFELQTFLTSKENDRMSFGLKDECYSLCEEEFENPRCSNCGFSHGHLSKGLKRLSS